MSRKEYPRCQFSVVMSVYYADDATHFVQAVHSVLDQSMLPSEVIISVDGPVTNNIRLALFELDKNPTVKILWHRENRGAGSARHAAISLARHDCVAIMDADDVALPTRFEKQINFLLSENYDAVGSFVEEFKTVPGDTAKIRKVPLVQQDILRFARWRQPVNHVTLMFRREAYMNVKGYRAYRSVEDFDLIYRLILSGARFANIPEVLVYVRTGASIVNRRSGLLYLGRELALMHRMRRDGFLSNIQWVLNCIIRIFVRLLPKFFIEIIYRALRN